MFSKYLEKNWRASWLKLQAPKNCVGPERFVLGALALKVQVPKYHGVRSQQHSGSSI